MICDEERLNFYLGTHRDRWLVTAPADVSLFVSTRILRDRKTLPRPPFRRGYVIDSGAFTELSMFGEFRTSPEQYVAELARYEEQIGQMDWAAPQDWMCEPPMLARTGLTVAEHQRRTVDNFLRLTELWSQYGDHPECPVMPVLQGWTIDDYLHCAILYERAGVDLYRDYPVVGVGSVCKRESTEEIESVFRVLASLDLPLHGFGVKTAGLSRYGRYLVSADSMAWSYAARHRAPLPDCSGHKNCANCMTYALAWRDRVLRAAA